MATAKMNTSGPSGGKGVPNAAAVKGSTVRTTGFQVRPHATQQIASRNLMGQKAQSKQSPFNKGPMTDFNTSGQKMGKTSPPKQAKVNTTLTNRNTQNSMRGTGSPKG